jgi:hypothetical protein
MDIAARGIIIVEEPLVRRIVDGLLLLADGAQVAVSGVGMY